MGSVYNATTNDTYTLTINKPLIIGRSVVNKRDMRVSRSHVQIVLLEDQRCFVKTLSQNACTLDNALLPKKINDQGIEEGEEVEAFDGQWIHLLPRRLYPFKLNLPKRLNDEILPPRKPLYQQKVDTDNNTESESENINSNNSYSDFNDDDDGEEEEEMNNNHNYSNNEKVRYHYSSDEESDDMEDNGENEDDDDSIISTESSLIGDEV
ncbi:hypothetical protein BJ944DRAFT_289807 [Cunninghamella echinulata]|nr:hypothetical protein BJ944DRAFT_289807 [Cunninghamella echinulata]